MSNQKRASSVGCYGLGASEPFTSDVDQTEPGCQMGKDTTQRTGYNFDLIIKEN